MPEIQRTAILDIRDAEISEEGVKNFYFPTLPQFATDFDNDLMKMAADFTKSHSSDSVYQAAIKLCMKFFITDACGFYHAEKMLAVMAADCVEPVLRPDWFAYALHHNQEIPKSRNVKILHDGPPKTPIWKKALNLKRLYKILKPASSTSAALFSAKGGLRYKPVTREMIRKNIIAAERTPLMIQHAIAQEEAVYFNRFYELFSEVTAKDSEKLDRQQLDKTADDLLGNTKALFEKHGSNLSKRSEAWLKDYFKDLLKGNLVHLERLLKVPEKLPRRLWIGTCGDRWNGLLATAVRLHGGHVTAHDHACLGHAHMPYHAFIESASCDEFVTFNRNQESAYRAEQEWEFFGKAPLIKGLNGSYELYNAPSSKAKKTVMYVTTVYERDRGRIGQVAPDLVRVDFQARHISFLVRNGYKVLIKGHPESPLAVPEFFKSLPNVEILNQPFMEARHLANHIVLDYVYTSVFKEALQTTLPITILDLEKVQWSKIGKDLIEKRASIVDVEFTSGNRARDYGLEIIESLEKSKHKANDRSFCDYFYGENNTRTTESGSGQ